MDAKKFKDIREKLEMSQEKFAQALEISFATVNRIEMGKSEIDNQTEKKLLQLEEIMNSDKIKSSKELGKAIMTAGLSTILSGAIAVGLINLPIASFLGLAAACTWDVSNNIAKTTSGGILAGIIKNQSKPPKEPKKKK